MWYLIAFLACLNVVHADSQCICPKRKTKAPDFVITAKVVERMQPEYGFIPYTIDDVKILEPNGLPSIEKTIYTLREAKDLFKVVLVPGTRYILEGEFTEENVPIVKGCVLQGRCGGEHEAR